jgi:hypothetical protein
MLYFIEIRPSSDIANFRWTNDCFFLIPANEFFVLLCGCSCKNAGRDFDPVFTQMCKAFARKQRVRILDCAVKNMPY